MIHSLPTLTLHDALPILVVPQLLQPLRCTCVDVLHGLGVAVDDPAERPAVHDEDLALGLRDDGRRTRDVREERDRKSTRLNSSHLVISYAVFCLYKKYKR